MRYLSICLALLVATTTPGTASDWCERSLSLVEHARAPVLAVKDPVILVVGKFDETYEFQGIAINHDGTDRPITLLISDKPGRAFYKMGRTPQSILGMPKIDQRFVGLALPHRRSLAHPDDEGKYYVMRVECAEGWVADPSPSYIQTLRRCWTGGDCPG